jgi:hypothetical protein
MKWVVRVIDPDSGEAGTRSSALFIACPECEPQGSTLYFPAIE